MLLLFCQCTKVILLNCSIFIHHRVWWKTNIFWCMLHHYFWVLSINSMWNIHKKYLWISWIKKNCTKNLYDKYLSLSPFYCTKNMLFSVLNVSKSTMICRFVHICRYLYPFNAWSSLKQTCSWKEPAKWRVTVSGELRFMTSYLES